MQQCGLRGVMLRVCDEIGGSAVQHSDGSVHVLHCPHWSARATAMLYRDCPDAVISVRSSVSSLSGFIVVVQQPQRTVVMRWRLCVAGLSTLMLFGLIWTLFSVQLAAASCPAAVSLKEAAFSFKKSIFDQIFSSGGDDSS